MLILKRLTKLALIGHKRGLIAMFPPWRRRLRTPYATMNNTEHLKSPNLCITLYDKEKTIREIAAELVRSQANPRREDPEDPFFIYDFGDVIAKDNRWRKLLPTVDTFYAVKCNPDPHMIRLLIGLGRGFDCASKRELMAVLDAGASPGKIIFAHPCKQVSHLRFARERGVRLMTFDTEEELYKIKRVHPGAKLVLRVSFDDVTAQIPLALKFGCRDYEWRSLVELAKKLELDLVGISFHVGTEAGNPHIFDDAIRYVRPMFDFGNSLGFAMDLLDIGGGFPGKLQPKKSFEEFADVIQKSLLLNFPPGCGVEVIAEPGTFYTRSAGYLVGNIIAKRVYKPFGDKEPAARWYYLNVGVFNALTSSLFASDYFPIPIPLKEPVDTKLKLSCIWGPTCDSADIISKRCMLPEMEEEDFVIITDAGSYTGCMGSNFNGYDVPPWCYIAPVEAREMLERIFKA